MLHRVAATDGHADDGLGDVASRCEVPSSF